MKKTVMGIISVIPIFLGIVIFILGKIAGNIAVGVNDADVISPEFGAMVRAMYVLSAVMTAAYILAVIIFFIYNHKNMYITHDKKVGWGYMLILIGIVAMPAYWYNFIYKE